MTDQTQNSDSAKINPNTNTDNSDIFGGSDDIFENSDILEPIKETLEADDGENRTIEQENDDTIEQKNDYNVDQNYSIPKVSDDVYDVDQSWNNEPSVSSPVVLDVKENDNNLDKDVLEQEDSFSQEENQNLNKNLEDNKHQNSDKENEDFFEKNDNLPGIENIEEIDNEYEKNDIFENIEPIQEVDLNQNIDDKIDLNNSSEIDILDDVDNINLVNVDDFDKTIEQENDETIGQENKEEKYQEINNYEAKQKEEMTEEKNEENTDSLEEGKKEEITEVVKEDEKLEKEKQAAHEIEIQVEVDQEKSDLQKKFYELIGEAKDVHELVNKDLSEGFDLLGGNDDIKKTMYKIFVGDDFVNIDRIETFKEDESEQIHTLSFVLEDSSLKVNVDDDLLYDEVEDLLVSPVKKMQVSEKLNKFIFLVTEDYKKIEKQKKEKEKRNMIKGIFRNF